MISDEYIDIFDSNATTLNYADVMRNIQRAQNENDKTSFYQIKGKCPTEIISCTEDDVYNLGDCINTLFNNVRKTELDTETRYIFGDTLDQNCIFNSNYTIDYIPDTYGQFPPRQNSTYSFNIGFEILSFHNIFEQPYGNPPFLPKTLLHDPNSYAQHRCKTMLIKCKQPECNRPLYGVIPGVKAWLPLPLPQSITGNRENKKCKQFSKTELIGNTSTYIEKLPVSTSFNKTNSLASQAEYSLRSYTQTCSAIQKIAQAYPQCQFVTVNTLGQILTCENHPNKYYDYLGFVPNEELTSTYTWLSNTSTNTKPLVLCETNFEGVFHDLDTSNASLTFQYTDATDVTQCNHQYPYQIRPNNTFKVLELENKFSITTLVSRTCTVPELPIHLTLTPPTPTHQTSLIPINNFTHESPLTQIENIEGINGITKNQIIAIIIITIIFSMFTLIITTVIILFYISKKNSTPQYYINSSNIF